jgi:hypothetical protein
VNAFVFSGAPEGFQRWGVEGALKYFYERNDLKVKSVDEPGAAELMRSPGAALLTWDAARHRLDITVIAQ